MACRRPPVQSPSFSFTHATRASHSSVAPLEPKPPKWVVDIFADRGVDPPAGPHERCGSIDVVRREPFVRVTTRIPGAILRDAQELSAAVADRYSEIDHLLTRLQKRALRIWNYVPGIVDGLGPGLDRYMAFNQGRHAAYTKISGSPECFARVVPSASAVGVSGQDLVIDCLASATGGTAVENPRQITSWQYSQRYGPKPPCFARGTTTVIDGRRALLLSGTASIVGEASRHPGNIRAQIVETSLNIAALIVNAGAPPDEPLQRLIDVRAYVVNAGDVDLVESELRARCGAALRIESAIARLCRPELLVEIEGVALLS